MYVKNIIKKYLIEKGYDGLCNLENECGCGLDDFMPCDGQIAECQPAHSRKATKADEEYYDAVSEGDIIYGP